MRNHNQPDDFTKKPRRLSAPLKFVFASIPILLVAGIMLLYWYENRLPDLTFPTTRMPADNAQDDFARVGKLVLDMRHPVPSLSRFPDYSLPALTAAFQDAQPVLSAVRQGLNKPFQGAE